MEQATIVSFRKYPRQAITSGFFTGSRNQ